MIKQSKMFIKFKLTKLSTKKAAVLFLNRKKCIKSKTRENTNINIVKNNMFKTSNDKTE